MTESVEREASRGAVTARDIIRAVQRGWWLILGGLVAGLLVAVAVSATTPTEYSAGGTLYVAAQIDAQQGDTPYQSSLLSQDRVKSYTQLIVSPRISQEVVDKLHLSIDASELQSHISATSDTGTVLIDITATASTPDQAADIENAVASVFTTAVAELEQPSDPTGRPAVIARVFQPAVVSADPVQPRWEFNLLLGGLLGLIVGAGAAVMRTKADSSVRSMEELQSLRGAAALAAVPDDPEAATSPLIQGRRSGPRVEAMGRLRTNLQFVDVDQPRKAIVLSSANSAEGKSSTALNLAAVLHRGGFSVIVVEGDLRRPSFEKYLGVSADVGLTSYLSGRCALEVAIQSAPSIGADVLPRGEEPPNPSELLGSSRMADLVQQLKASYDYVVVDAPPLPTVADAAVLTSLCDGLILVVQQGRTTTSDVRACLEAIDSVHGQLLGYVLNRTPRAGRANYYSYTGEESTPAGPLPPPAVETHPSTNGARPSPAPRG